MLALVPVRVKQVLVLALALALVLAPVLALRAMLSLRNDSMRNSGSTPQFVNAPWASPDPPRTFLDSRNLPEQLFSGSKINGPHRVIQGSGWLIAVSSQVCEVYYKAAAQEGSGGEDPGVSRSSLETIYYGLHSPSSSITWLLGLFGKKNVGY